MKRILALILSLLFCQVASASDYGPRELESLMMICIATHTSAGAAADADSPPEYRVYSHLSATPVTTGTLILTDSANTAGFYAENILLEAVAGFENNIDYHIVIIATVGGVTTETIHTFRITSFSSGDSSWDALRSAHVIPGSFGEYVNANLEAILGEDFDVETPNTFFDDLQTSVTGIGTTLGVAGAGLTAVPWNVAWDAEVQSEAADSLNAFGFNNITAASVWTTGTRTLSAGTNIVLAKGTGITGFNDLDAAGIRTAVGLTSANLNTQLAGIESGVDVDTIEAVDATDQLDAHAASGLDAAGVRAAIGLTGANLDTQLINIESGVDVDTIEGVDATNQLSAFGGLDAAGVRAAVGLGSANLDTQLADIPTVAEFNARTLTSATYATTANLTIVNGILDNMFTGWELDGGVYRLTANAVELAPSAGTVTLEAEDLEAIGQLAGEAAAAAIDFTTVLNAISALNDLSMADVRTAVGLAAANLDTQLNTINDFLDTEIEAIEDLLDTEMGTLITQTGEPAIRGALGLATNNLDIQLANLPTESELNARTLPTAQYATAAGVAAIDFTAVLNALNALNDLSANEVRTAVGLASANLDTQLTGILAEFGDILVSGIILSPEQMDILADEISTSFRSGGGNIGARVAGPPLTAGRFIEIVQGEEKIITFIVEPQTGFFVAPSPDAISVKLSDVGRIPNVVTIEEEDIDSPIVRVTEESDIQVFRVTLTSETTEALREGLVRIELTLGPQKARINQAIKIIKALP